MALALFEWIMGVLTAASFGGLVDNFLQLFFLLALGGYSDAVHISTSRAPLLLLRLVLVHHQLSKYE